MPDEQDYLFSDVVATGKNAWTPSSGILPQYMLEENEEDDETQAEVLEENLGTNEQTNIDEDFGCGETETQDVPNQSNPRRTVPSIERIRNKKINKPKKMSFAQQLVKCLQTMASKVDNITHNGCSCVKMDETATLGACLYILDNMAGVVAGGKVWLYATRVLLNPDIRDLFSRIKTDGLRQIWLEDHMERDMIKRGGVYASTSTAGGSKGLTGDNKFTSA